MKTNDKELVKNLYYTQKVTETKTKKNLPSIINRIIDYIKKKDRPCSLTELHGEIKEIDIRSKEFLSALSKYSEKLKFDERSEMLSLRSKYALSNIEDLKDTVFSKEINYCDDIAVSDSCIDLIKKMLEKDDNKRITMEAIKNHPWMKTNLSTVITTPTTMVKSIPDYFGDRDRTSSRPISIAKTDIIRKQKDDDLIFSLED